MRLNVFLAQSGLCSRRKADELIKKGSVFVNGEKIISPGTNVLPSDNITYKQKILKIKEYRYIILNKPKGAVCTLKDKFADKTVVSLLPKSLGRVFPAGRLDKNTTGLLILTNDGNFCNFLAHPRYQIEKEYEVEINKPFKKPHTAKVLSGIKDRGEILRFKKVKLINNHKTFVRVVLTQGKKREIRRVFAFLGYNVVNLKRVRIGSLRLKGLKEGQWRKLSLKEKQKLIKDAGSA